MEKSQKKKKNRCLPWVDASVVPRNGIEPIGDLGLFVVDLHGCHRAILYLAFGDLCEKALRRLELGLVVLYQSPWVDLVFDILYSEA